MIIKVNLYFSIEAEEGAKIENHELLRTTLEEKVNSFLEETDFKLKGSWWDGNRIIATHLTPKKAMEKLRTKK